MWTGGYKTYDVCFKLLLLLLDIVTVHYRKQSSCLSAVNHCCYAVHVQRTKNNCL